MQFLLDLVKVHDAYTGGVETLANQGQAMDGFSALANYDDIAEKVAACMQKYGRLNPS